MVASRDGRQILVGGSEAPLTPFTLAQMKALKVYSRAKNEKGLASFYPCLSLDLDKKENSMILGEGAAVACLELGKKENALGLITGVGYNTEKIAHNVAISAEGLCFQEAMQMALGDMPKEEVDVIVTHTPGTIKGDESEVHAIHKVFGEHIPMLTNNKWQIGHTFGASGMLSVALAIQILHQQKVLEIPYINSNYPQKGSIRNILINAVGFGGNAVSILLSK